MTSPYDIAVIGAGPGGYLAALKAAQKGAKTALVERHLLGGTCLNYGCIPSKALLASAELAHRIASAGELGLRVAGPVEVDWPAIQSRKDKVVAGLRGGVKGLLRARGVDVFEGSGVVEGPGRLAVLAEGKPAAKLSAKNVIIAVGSTPTRIPGWPSDPQLVCTSDEALHWKTLPSRLLIVGGGVIGCEFACMMQSLGVQVSVVEMLPSLLGELDEHLGEAIAKAFAKRGIACMTSTKVEDLSLADGGVRATLTGGKIVQADRVLVAVGRRPATDSLGLDKLALTLDRGFLRVDSAMRTAAKGVYCIGDANGRCLLAHAASAQGMVAVENALGHAAEWTAPTPYCVYTFPEVASVGITQRQARARNLPVAVGVFPLSHLGKALAVGESEGFVKVLRHRLSGKLLGVHMLGHNVTEVIAAAGAMLHQEVTVEQLADVTFAHPTISEALKEAAEDSLGAALHLPPRKVLRLAATTA